MKLPQEPVDPTARRLLLVVSDEKYEALTRSIAWSRVLERALDFAMPWRQLVRSLATPAGAPRGSASEAEKRSMESAVRVLGEEIALSSFAASSVAFAASPQPAGDREWWVRREIPIPHLSPVEASQRFSFTVGHPIDGTAYGLLPSASDKYVPLALVDEMEKQSRLAGCKALLGALGAKTVHVISKDSRARTSAIDVSVDGQAGGAGNASVSTESSGHTARQILAEFGPPRHPPHVPAKHEVWLTGDPALAALVENRLEHELMRDSFTFEAGREEQVSAKLCTGLQKLGLSVGGEYRHAEAEVWRCEATFWRWPSESPE